VYLCERERGGEGEREGGGGGERERERERERWGDTLSRNQIARIMQILRREESRKLFI
jgi:hypothetical protein